MWATLRLKQQDRTLPGAASPREPSESLGPEVPDVVGVLGLQVSHQRGHGRLELRAGCRGPLQVDLGGVPLGEQGLDEGVASLPHGLGQVSVEEVIVFVHKSFYLVQHLRAT